MKSRAICLTLFSTIAISITASLPAQAQRARVFVSVTGNDSNPCTAGSPCKTFQAAHDAVLAGGEISVLDTGGYGTLLITKSLSIVAIGVEASIAIPSGSNGITITAGSTGKVSLRGLTLDGAGVGTTGIRFDTGASLTVEDCVVRNMTGSGLEFVSTATTPQTLAVSNSLFNDNGLNGMSIGTFSSGAVIGAIERTGFYGNGQDGLTVSGFSGTGALTVAVTDSVAANNGAGTGNTIGFSVDSAANHSPTNLSLTHSLAEGNGRGLEAAGVNATLWLAQSTVTGNGNGYVVLPGGVINSYGDNYITANGFSTGNLTPVGKQ